MGIKNKGSGLGEDRFEKWTFGFDRRAIVVGSGSTDFEKQRESEDQVKEWDQESDRVPSRPVDIVRSSDAE